ncbi:MAG: esterase/lipase family protein [bacterium]
MLAALVGVVSECFAWIAFQILTATYLLLSPFRPFPTCYGNRGNATPVLLIHGYQNNPAIFWVLIARLRKAGFTSIHAVTLFPFWGSIPHFAHQISDAVDLILARSGGDRVDIVAHSMGGLAAAHYIKHLRGKEKVRKFIPLAAPFRGTYAAYLALGACGFQMRPGSGFTKELDFKPADVPPVKVFSLRAGLDEYVVPHNSAVLDEPAGDVELDHLGHGAILFSKRAAHTIIELLAP